MSGQVITLKNAADIWVERGQRFFFDTNVVIALQAPYTNPNSWEAKVYSKLLFKILRIKGRIVINSVVIHEYMQTCVKKLHRELVRAKEVSENYKTFRMTAAFEKRAHETSMSLIRFCQWAEILDTVTKKEDLKRYCDEFCSGRIDFPDLLILETCRQNSCTLVTHDRDVSFAEDVDWITANQELRLSERPARQQAVS